MVNLTIKEKVLIAIYCEYIKDELPNYRSVNNELEKIIDKNILDNAYKKLNLENLVGGIDVAADGGIMLSIDILDPTVKGIELAESIFQIQNNDLLQAKIEKIYNFVSKTASGVLEKSLTALILKLIGC